MYNKINVIIAILMLCLVASCGNKKTNVKRQSEFIRPASMNYTHEDTARIMQLVDDYIAGFAQKDYDRTADMLYKVKNDSVFPLSDKEKAGYKKAMSMMPNYGCKLKSFILNSDKNNDVAFYVQMVPNGNLEQGIGVTSLSLNPVIKDGKWYLTIRDKHAEGVEDVYKQE